MADFPAVTGAYDVKEGRQEAFAAFRELLVRLSVRQILVLSIDDLQWGDIESASLISSLLQGSEPPQVVLLFCYRSDYLQRSECLNALSALPLVPNQRVLRQNIKVDAFKPDEAKQLAQALLGPVRDSKQHIERIVSEAQGSAMFVSELVQQVLTGEHASIPRGVGIGLDGMIWERVQQLPEPARHLLEVACIAGQPLRLATLQSAAGHDRLPLHLLSQLRSIRLIRLEGLRVENTIEPYHDRIRESVVNHLPDRLKSERHASLATALE